MRLALALSLWAACATEPGPADPSAPGPAQGPPAPGAGPPGGPPPGAPGGGGPPRSAGPDPTDRDFPPAEVDAEGMVRIPGGWVRAGWSQIGPDHSDTERPKASPWTLGQGAGLRPVEAWVAPFRIQPTEVTRAQYREFLLATGYRPPSVEEAWFQEHDWGWKGTDYHPGTADHPVVGTSWYDAWEYCHWRGWRLPTDVEWTLATYGPAEDGRTYPWGRGYDAGRLNHGRAGGELFDDSDGYLTTAPVGSFPRGRSPYGLEDTFGNVWEWVEDNFRDDWRLVDSRPYEHGITDVFAGGPGMFVVVRGGSYYFDVAVNPHAERTFFARELRRKSSGFRCAADP
ncbi:formylglycine-generating enzyme family protein [Myxococcota bacterium]|nr:formylglycine-generating enzyme family protein [Myxococcota bacterium]